jgi:mono/diheme cytochrome c family protein
MDRCQRIKVIAQGPDGYIYILTDQMPPLENEILRLVPARTPPAPKMPEPGAPIPVPQPGPGARPAAPAPATAAAPAPAGAQATPEELALGATAYVRACASCHGAQGEGGIGPRVAGRTDAALIASVIREGAGAMPALAGAVSPAEIDAVSKYVARLPR